MQHFILNNRRKNNSPACGFTRNKVSKYFGIACLCVLSSCKKDEFKSVELASFTVVNAVGSLSVKSDFTGKNDVFSTTETQTDFNRSTRFVAPTNQTVPLTVVSSIDPTQVLFARSFTFAPGDIYSLFLMGELPAIDTILVKESFPEIADNSMAVRFLNGSPSVGELKIVPIMVDTLGIETPLEQIAGLGYKNKTEFLTFPIPGSLSTYKLEIREALTDNLLTTFILSAEPGSIFTSVFRGAVGGSPSFGRLILYHKPVFL